MAKRRGDRRVKENQTRKTPSSPRYINYRFVIFIFFSIFIPILSFYIYRMKYTTTTTTTLSVYKRGLVKPITNYQETLTKFRKILRSQKIRLGLIIRILYWRTSLLGYELAKRFNSKFTHLSPVWYDLKSDGADIVLDGRHNADMGWISELRKNGHALVMPRVVIEAFPNNLLRKKQQRDKAIDLIVMECKEMEYDGIVLESWSRWAAYGVLHDPEMRNMALKFIKQLGQALHSVRSERKPENYLQLIYVIGPPSSAKLQEHDFGPRDLQSLSDAVDGFSLMTYDFSGPHNPGPNAPLKWITATVRILLGATGSSELNLARKIFIGMNFYGNDFLLSKGVGGGAITGSDYLSLLEKHRPVLQWDEESEEHFFVYSDNNQIKHAVFYPSLMSISMRLEEARALGAGISIWEIGQGLDYFFDLL